MASGSRSGSKEQKLLLRVKKDLEIAYKTFIQFAFTEPKEGTNQVEEKMAAEVNAVLTEILSRLSDYYADITESAKEIPRLIIPKKLDPNKLLCDKKSELQPATGEAVHVNSGGGPIKAIHPNS